MDRKQKINKLKQVLTGKLKITEAFPKVLVWVDSEKKFDSVIGSDDTPLFINSLTDITDGQQSKQA